MEKIKHLLVGTKFRAIITGIAVFVLVSLLDLYTRNEISVDIFYFIPLFVLTWSVGWRWGVAAALGATVDWLLDERLFSASYPWSLNILIWNAVVRLAFFLLVVLLVDQVRTLLLKERSVSKLKSMMIHTVSHEFNNALTGLSAGLFLLRETDPEAVDETRSRLYTSMDGSQHKLALYVKNILNEARMEEGRFKVERRVVVMRDLAVSAAESVQQLFLQKEIKFSIEAPKKPVLVSADGEALALVISNLLGNAVKYTRQGGKITVRIDASMSPPGLMIFSVEDSGIGISLADLKKITAGFYRTEEGKSEAEGFGLGLKVSNELLALHGSRLEISSEKGKGSRFYFELPALPPSMKKADGRP